MIDIHVHIAAFPSKTNGCFMSPPFQKGVLSRLVRWKLDLHGNSADEINQCYIERLQKNLIDSRYVKKAVILALDGVYDESGALDQQKTSMLIGNDYVNAIAKKYPDQFLFGASVNPQRRDAIEELQRVIELGAKLIKILPPSQDFNPMDERYRSFYRIMAEHKIPLLCHIGHEYSVTAKNQEFGTPNRLSLALDEGVIVIGAHACSSGLFFQGQYTRMMEELVEKYPNFYMDLSATTLFNRANILFYLKRRPELASRLIFGTDYPLSAYASPFLGRFSIVDQWKFWRTKNIFDKQAMVLEALGIQHDPALARRLLRLQPADTTDARKTIEKVPS
jgi:predicted TIM-barrel fold metal-dependent hydrolase